MRWPADPAGGIVAFATEPIVLLDPDANVKDVYCWERRPPFDAIALLAGRVSAACLRGRRVP